jgi:fused-like protein
MTDTQFEDCLIEIISNSNYKNEISPKGINAALNIILTLMTCEYKMIIRKVLREHCMKQLIIFIKRKQYIAIKDWPGFKSNEGITIAQNIYLNTLKIIKLAAELNGITEGIVKSDFFFNLRNSFDIIQKEYYKIIISILNIIISGKHDENVSNTCFEFFKHTQNLKFIENFNMLKDLHNKELIIEVLAFLSALCRKSSEIYNTIHQLNIFPDLKNLLENSNETSFKSRVCNLLGNMCRHTDFFYEQIKSSGIIVPLLKCCYEKDKATRKFACFAIGNAAFLNDKLYECFRPIIPRMVELLHDHEENTRANSAGALGNFVRCGDTLCDEIINAKAHEALINLAETEEIAQIQIIRVALFALGNFCNHAKIKQELDKINFRQRIENIKEKFRNDRQLMEHIERIQKKLN